MRYCVREDRPDMCPLYLPKKCQRYGDNWEYFPDGICIDKDSNPPSQIVCPIGLVLCPDLTCRENHDECELSPELPDNKVRCVDQTITSFQEYTCRNIALLL